MKWLKRNAWWFSMTAILFLIVVGAVVYFFVIDPANKQRCRDAGGRVLELHNARGGWFCTEEMP